MSGRWQKDAIGAIFNDIAEAISDVKRIAYTVAAEVGYPDDRKRFHYIVPTTINPMYAARLTGRSKQYSREKVEGDGRNERGWLLRRKR